MRILLAAAAVALIAFGPAQAADIANGEKVFKKCAACHMVGENAKKKTGPVLNELFGRVAGTDPDYLSAYSKDMIAAGAGGLTWNEETLTTYLAKPKDMIPKTKMAFAGLKKPEEIADVIAYLKQYTPE